MQCWRSPQDEHVPLQSWLHIVDPLSSCSSSHTEWGSTLHNVDHKVRFHSTLGRSQGERNQVWQIARGRSRTPRQQSRYESTCFALETRALYAQETLSEIDCGVWCQRGFLKHLCFCCFKKPLPSTAVCGYAFNANCASPKFWFIIDGTAPEERHNLNQKHHLTHSAFTIWAALLMTRPKNRAGCVLPGKNWNLWEQIQNYANLQWCCFSRLSWDKNCICMLSSLPSGGNNKVCLLLGQIYSWQLLHITSKR